MLIERHEVDPTPIARGGGAQAVYRGIDGVTGQVIAIKVLGEHASADLVTRNKFEEEFTLVQSFVHPYSSSAYRWGDDPVHGVFFTMPFFAEGDWLRARDGSPIASGVLLNRFVEVVGVILTAHRQTPALLHRDLKPTNILLHLGHSRVSDWGIGRPFGPSAEYTQSNGTPGWRAPEQAGGRTGPFTDVWGLAGLAGWILTGLSPDTLSADIRGGLARHGWDTFAPFFERGLAESPSERFASVMELWDAFSPLFGKIKRLLWQRSTATPTDRSRLLWATSFASESPAHSLQPRGLKFQFRTRRSNITVPYAEVAELADRVIAIGPRLLRATGVSPERSEVWRMYAETPLRFNWSHGPVDLSRAIAKSLEELPASDAEAVREFMFLADDRIATVPAQFSGEPEDK